MKRLFLIFFLVIGLTSLFAEEQVSGTIYFTDNTSVRFMNFEMFIRFDIHNSRAFFAEYQNSIRELKLKHLASITVKSWETVTDRNGREPRLGPGSRFVIVTNTGITLETPEAHGNYLFGVKVKIIDELTGEIKQQDFQMLKKISDKSYTLNIKRIVFNGPEVSQAAGHPLYRITKVRYDDSLNLRSRPDSESEIVAKIPYNGTHLYYLGEKEPVENYDWYKVRYGGIEGWVNSYFLAPDPLTYVPVTGKAAAKGTAVLESPSHGSVKLRILESGETVAVIGMDSKKTWIKVRLPDGLEGYVPVSEVTVDVEKLLEASTRDAASNYVADVSKAVTLGYSLYRTDDPYEMIEIASSSETQSTVANFFSSSEEMTSLLNQVFDFE